MSTQQGTDTDSLTTTVMTLRIIVVALAAGALSFAAVATFLHLNNQPQQGGGGMLLTPIGVVAAVAAVVGSRLLPAVMVKAGRAQIRAGTYGAPGAQGKAGAAAAEPSGVVGKLCALYQTKTIVAAALLEGAAFLNLTALLIEESWLGLGVGIALAVAILAMFPSHERVAEWVDEQSRLLDAEKLLVR